MQKLKRDKTQAYLQGVNSIKYEQRKANVHYPPEGNEGISSCKRSTKLSHLTRKITDNDFEELQRQQVTSQENDVNTSNTFSAYEISDKS